MHRPSFWQYLKLLKTYDQSIFPTKEISSQELPSRFGILIELNILERAKEVIVGKATKF